MIIQKHFGYQRKSIVRVRFVVVLVEQLQVSSSDFVVVDVVFTLFINVVKNKRPKPLQKTI